MRGTSSDDIKLEGVFVPDRYVARIVPAGTADAFVLGIFAWALMGFANVYCGIAQRAIDLAVASTKGKTSLAVTRTMAYHPEVQHRIAQMVLANDTIAPHLDQVADALMGAGYGSAGERCMAISVAVPVGDATANRLVAALRPRIESLKVGPYTASDSDFGPVVTGAARERISGLVDRGIAEGAELVVDGRNLKMQGYEKGFYMGPCLFDHVTPQMDIYKAEIFGPVLSIARSPDYETALRMVNDNEYGNGVAIFTRDGDAARDFANRCQIGMVGVNVPIPTPLAYYGFGGWKRSAFGDLNQHGPDSIKFWTRTKTVTARWPSGIKSGAEFSIPVISEDQSKKS